MESTIREVFSQAQTTLEKFVNNHENVRLLEDSISQLISTYESSGKVLSCGNGGSMCDAMHFAEELSGRYKDDRPGLAAISISDPSHITCVANDYGYEQVFSRYIQSLGQEGDVLLAISTSGNSKNVINAIHAARDKGMKVIGLTGKNGGQMAELCDIEIRAPHSKYADRAQEIHIKVIHSLIDFIESNIDM